MLSRFSKSGLCGIVFTFIPQSCELVEELNRTIGDRNSLIKVNTVEIDSVRSGKLVAEHLIQLGHTDIISFLRH